MKNNEENIDKIVRDRISEHDFGNPPKDFIDDLNRRLDERESHGFFGPWNGLLDVVLIVLFAIYPLIQSTTVASNVTFSEMQGEKLDSTSSSSNEQDYILENSSSSSIEPQSEENESTQSVNNLEYSKGKDLSASKENTVRSNNTESFIRTNTSLTNDTKTTNNSKLNKSSKQSSNLGKKNQKTETGVPQTQVNQKENPSEIKRSSNSGKDEKENVLSDFNNKGNALVYATQYPIVDSKIRSWSFPPIVSTMNSSSSVSLEENKEIVESPINWELQLSSGLNFATLNNSNNSNGSALLLSQQSGFGPSFTIGGRITMWYNDFAITSGLEFLSIKEENLFELNEVQSYDSTYVTNVDTTIFFDSVNQTWDTTYTFDYDSTTVTDTVLSTIPVSQQYSWIQIPLEVGYKFQFNKWAIIPRAGINLAIGIRQQNKAYPNESFDQLQTYTPSAKVLMNLTGSIEVRRYFNNWHAFARGNYQTGMRPILTGDYFERRYSGFQMNVGIGLTLGQ